MYLLGLKNTKSRNIFIDYVKESNKKEDIYASAKQLISIGYKHNQMMLFEELPLDICFDDE